MMDNALEEASNYITVVALLLYCHFPVNEVTERMIHHLDKALAILMREMEEVNDEG